MPNFCLTDFSWLFHPSIIGGSHQSESSADFVCSAPVAAAFPSVSPWLKVTHHKKWHRSTSTNSTKKRGRFDLIANYRKNPMFQEVLMLEMQVKLMLCNSGRIPMNFFKGTTGRNSGGKFKKKRTWSKCVFWLTWPSKCHKICPASRFLCSFCPRAVELQLEFEAQIVELFVQVKFWPCTNIFDSILLTFSCCNHVASTVS